MALQPIQGTITDMAVSTIVEIIMALQPYTSLTSLVISSTIVEIIMALQPAAQKVVTIANLQQQKLLWHYSLNFGNVHQFRSTIVEIIMALQPLNNTTTILTIYNSRNYYGIIAHIGLLRYINQIYNSRNYYGIIASHPLPHLLQIYNSRNYYGIIARWTL